jgi:hypothetical protein
LSSKPKAKTQKYHVLPRIQAQKRLANMRQSNLSAIPKSVPSTRQQKRRYKNFLGFCFYSANRKIYALTAAKSCFAKSLRGAVSHVKNGPPEIFSELGS